ncbi:MAG: hypothetical protein U9N87_01085, partial [Planctomycetota bacterium]|nr:hypothetical protein [Planctomycetota bacterium]
RTRVPLVHVVEEVKLPLRMVTEKECAEVKAKVDAMKKKGDTSRRLGWHQAVLDRYKTQKPGSTCDMEMHVIRLGDVAIATNRFELFTDFGIQMKSRSKALQTFVIQLTGPGSYLPTAEAAKGGGYSAIVESNLVGPKGGQILVDRTVEELNKLF